MSEEEQLRQVAIAEVKERIRLGATSRDILTLLFVRLLELERPDWRIEMVSEDEIKLTRPNEESFSIFLPNLWVECEKEPEERLEICERRIQVLASDEEKDEVLVEQIVPLVRDSTYREFVKAEERELIAPHLVGDLWIVYAVDRPDSTEVLSAQDVARLKLDPVQLRQVSIDNLVGLLTDIQAEPYGKCFALSCENIIYAAGALLLDSIWDQLDALVDGDIVVGVPARDTVIFAGSDDAEALVELRAEVTYVVTTGHHLVSETLLRRTGGKWESFS